MRDLLRDRFDELNLTELKQLACKLDINHSEDINKDDLRDQMLKCMDRRILTYMKYPRWREHHRKYFLELNRYFDGIDLLDIIIDLRQIYEDHYLL